jgi:hypothetical protein
MSQYAVETENFSFFFSLSIIIIVGQLVVYSRGISHKNGEPLVQTPFYVAALHHVVIIMA